jgi:hypothetical protein
MIGSPIWHRILLYLALIFAVASVSSAAEIKGKIKSVDTDINAFQVLVDDRRPGELAFKLAQGGKVFINERASMLAELRPGDNVMVTYERVREVLIASEVRCTRR